jgi:hypothetical protein
LADDTRIESEVEIEAYLARLKYALRSGVSINYQEVRKVDDDRDIRYTNRYTITDLFPDENPIDVLRRELMTLSKKEYLQTIKDNRFLTRSEMREFGRVYNGNADVYIKIRVELLNLNSGGNQTTFVMSFHYSTMPFCNRCFPYCN